MEDVGKWEVATEYGETNSQGKRVFTSKKLARKMYLVTEFQQRCDVLNI